MKNEPNEIEIDVRPEDVMEDSGVIDLRALFEEQRANAATGERRPLVVDAPPLVSPPRERPASKRTGFVAWAASVAVFALSAIVFAAVPRTGSPEVLAEVTAPEKTVESTAGGMTPVRQAATPVPLVDEAAADAEPEADDAAEAESETRAARTSTTRRRTARVPDSVDPAPATPAHDWEAGSADGNSALDASIQELLDRAIGGASPAAGVSEEALPATPTRRQVSTTLRALEGEVRRCVEDGVVPVRLVTHGPTGRVTQVTVRGELAGTAAARCVASAVESARFPRFERERFIIDFPYVL